MGAFEARLEVHEGACHVVLTGEIDLVAVPELFARMQEADRTTPGRVVVFMQDVTLLDSSGLGVFFRLAAAGVDMEVRGATGVVSRALEISGLALAPNVRVIADDT
jgi:anti-anti-sigma factor